MIHFLMTNNQRILTEYRELNYFAAFLFIVMLAVIAWYIQWNKENKSN